MTLVIEGAFAVSSLVFILTGLAIAGMALRAYVNTAESPMLYMAVGLSIAVAGSAATLISAFLTDFGDGPRLLLVNSVFFTVGFLLLMYSLLIYE